MRLRARMLLDTTYALRCKSKNYGGALVSSEKMKRQGAGDTSRVHVGSRRPFKITTKARTTELDAFQFSREAQERAKRPWQWSSIGQRSASSRSCFLPSPI